MHTLEIKKLNKKIKTAVILEDIDLKMEGGKIYGFMGKNGSGKTMLFRCLAGMVRPTSGEILVNGKRLYQEISLVPNIGIIIENVGMYPEFTGFKNLKLLAGINKKIDDDTIRNAIRRVGLDPDDRRTVRKYSMGMRQRIVFAQAIMESPDFLYLDEPTNGLDEDGGIEFRKILKEESARGALILIASHNREDIDLLCDAKYRMSEGKLEEWS